MKNALVLLFWIAGLAVSYSQNSWMTLDLDDAETIAQHQGQFILLRFTAEWCGPCRAMERESWSQPAVQTIQGEFVSLNIDLQRQPGLADQFGVSAIPTLVILDGFGNEYWRYQGYLTQAQLIEEIGGFPQNMSSIYQAEEAVKEADADYRTHFRLGDLYQRYSYQAGATVADQFLSQSTSALRKSKRLLRRDEAAPQGLSQRIELLLIENQLLRGRYVRSLQDLGELRQEVETSNQAIYNYLLTMAYRQAGNTDKAREHYQELQEADNNQRWLVRLAKW
ncbi:MAG: thioredoxin domain-containing protein [Bacteroidota bacterium]